MSSRAVRLLSSHGVSCLLPRKSPNVSSYTPPLVPPRIAKSLRREAMVNGTYGTWCDQAGGWLKEWDKAFERENRKGGRWGVQTLRPNKGRLSARNREDRARKIEEKMETMDRLIADHRRAEKERTGKKEGIEALYKRIIARAGRR